MEVVLSERGRAVQWTGVTREANMTGHPSVDWDPLAACLSAGYAGRTCLVSILLSQIRDGLVDRDLGQ